MCTECVGVYERSPELRKISIECMEPTVKHGVIYDCSVSTSEHRLPNCDAKLL